MPSPEVFRLNYYVSGLLAQGGNVWLEDSKLIFSPTSALDRAMGAKNVEILFSHVRGMNYGGALTRSFSLSTDGKVHKFEGSQAKRVCELLEKVLPKNGAAPVKITVIPASPPSAPSPVKHASGFSCMQCQTSLQPGFCYCPHCGTAIKSICKSCRRTIDPNWSVCAFCGWKFSAAANH